MADKHSCLRDVTPKNEVTGTKGGDVYYEKRKTQNNFNDAGVSKIFIRTIITIDDIFFLTISIPTSNVVMNKKNIV